MICPKCDANIPDGTRFCPYCGSDLAPEESVQAAEAAEEKVTEAIDTAEDTAGDIIEEAQEEVKEEAAEAAETAEEVADTAHDAVENAEETVGEAADEVTESIENAENSVLSNVSGEYRMSSGESGEYTAPSSGNADVFSGRKDEWPTGRDTEWPDERKPVVDIPEFGPEAKVLPKENAKPVKPVNTKLMIGIIAALAVLAIVLGVMLISKQGEIGKIESRIGEYQALNEEYYREYDQLEEDAISKDATITQLSGELDEKITENSALEEKYADLQSETENLNAQIEELTEESERLDKVKETLNAVIDTATKSNTGVGSDSFLTDRTVIIVKKGSTAKGTVSSGTAVTAKPANAGIADISVGAPENGQAAFTVTGKDTGATGITFTHEGDDTSFTVIVIVTD